MWPVARTCFSFFLSFRTSRTSSKNAAVRTIIAAAGPRAGPKILPLLGLFDAAISVVVLGVVFPFKTSDTNNKKKKMFSNLLLKE